MDLNDYPTPTQTIPWKPILMIGGGVIVAIVLVVIGIRLIQSHRQEAVMIEQMGKQAAQTAQSTCEDADDEETCRDRLLVGLAQDYGSEDLCELITSEASKDDCYWGLAREREETGYCAGISQESYRTRCADDIFQMKALAQSDSQLCQSIIEEVRRERCVRTLDPLTMDNCAQREEEAVCADLERQERAVETKSLMVCSEIVNESRREHCVEIVSSALDRSDTDPIDSDQDGLTDEAEAFYGTDPNNPDTDGDGFTDGEEVSAGYNPTGPGLLTDRESTP